MAVEEEGWSKLTPEQRAELLCKDIEESFLTEDIKGFILIGIASDGHIISSWGEYNLQEVIGALLQHLQKALESYACTTEVVMK